MKNRIGAIGACCLLATSATLYAGETAATETVLIHQDFEQADKFPLGPQPVGTLNKWEAGEEGPLGSIAVATIDTPKGLTKAARIGNVAHRKDRAPGLLLNWPEAEAGTLTVEYRFMTPIDGPFYSVHYFGGDWKTAAVIFIIKDGKFTLQYGENDARVPLGAYASNEWHTIRYEFDLTGQKVDVYLDGEKRAKQLPWQSGSKALDHATLYADFTDADHGGAAVQYIDDIVVDVKTPAGAPTTAPSQQAAAPLKSLERSFRYGVCSHLGRYKGADFDKLVDAIDRLGVDIVRDGVDWNSIQPAEGTWAFDRQDKIVNGLIQRGVELQPLLAFSAKWASTGPTDTKDWHDWNNRAPRLEPFNAYAAAMVNRYKDRIHLWEIWNEPEIAFWLSTPAEYVQLFNAASATVMQADPKAKVLNGGFSMEHRPPNMNFLPEFLQGADPTHWGVWAYHDYNTFGQMIARAKESRQYYDSKKLNIPVWINEGGFNTLTRGGEAEQAVSLAKKIAAAPSMGIGAYIWYDLIDDGDKPLDPEDHFGLLHRDFSPKPAFIAYQQLIRELAPRKFAKRLADDEVPGLWGLLYRARKDQGDHVLVLWREGEGRQTPLWIGARDEGSVTAVYAMDGTAVPVAQLDGGALVTVSDRPMYVHLRGTLNPVVRPILLLPDKLAVLPGQDNLLRFQLTNPTDHDATFAVSMSTDSSSLQTGAPLPDVHLGAGKSTSLTLNARLADSAVGKGNGIVTLSLRSATDGPAVEAKLPYVVASAIPKLPDASADDIPDGQGLVLKTETVDSIVNLYSAEPNPTMHWNGADDLSAVARVAYTADALLLRVTAKDDAHVQHYGGADIWRSDSIQFAIRTDDSRPEYFEAGMALAEDGKPQGWLYSLPAGSSLALGAMDKQSLAYDVKREGTQTIYSVRIPWKALGIDGPPASGMRMNYLINDDDGQGRKGWVQLTDGIGRAKNPSLFTLFVCN